MYVQVSELKREEYSDLALEIFTKHATRDLRTYKTECTSCSMAIPTWYVLVLYQSFILYGILGKFCYARMF